MGTSRGLRTVRVCLLMVLFLGVAARSWAQTETGRVTGVVLDQTGAVLPGASISLISTDTGVVRTGTSDKDRRYVFANVLPGPYNVKITLSGFADQSARITVNGGGHVSVETKLKLAGQAETISVVAESAVINTVNGELSSTIRQEQIRDLPTIT